MRRYKLKVVLIDEYRTSKMCPACDGVLEKFHSVPSPRPFRVRRRPEVLCNGLLRRMSKECIGWVTQNSGRKRHGRRTPANDDTPGANDDTPAADDGTDSDSDDDDDDDVAAQTQHLPTMLSSIS
ncbi:hypothetical protein LPJ59_001715 [Coemansia sp. RSA 2399]|nr:hypothetical protein LPJ59_001715 [Coemansia sp. RSA 2399]